MICSTTSCRGLEVVVVRVQVSVAGRGWGRGSNPYAYQLRVYCVCHTLSPRANSLRSSTSPVIFTFN